MIPFLQDDQSERSIDIAAAVVQDMQRREHFAASPGPFGGECDYCTRDRNDLFYHAEDDAFYCVDVFRCEARAG